MNGRMRTGLKNVEKRSTVLILKRSSPRPLKVSNFDFKSLAHRDGEPLNAKVRAPIVTA